MAGQVSVDWLTCDLAGCDGVRLDGGDKCLAHTADEEREAALRQLSRTGKIDVRGVTIDSALLEKILDSARGPHRGARTCVPETVPAPGGQVRPRRATSTPGNGGRAQSGRRSRPRPGNRAPVTPEQAELAFVPVLADGVIPSLRAVRRELHVGTDKARQIREHLETVTGCI